MSTLTMRLGPESLQSDHCVPRPQCNTSLNKLNTTTVKMREEKVNRRVAAAQVLGKQFN